VPYVSVTYSAGGCDAQLAEPRQLPRCCLGVRARHAVANGLARHYSPAFLPHVSDADAVLACIQIHITCVVVAIPAEADLSVKLHTCPVFMRALQQLLVCVDRACRPALVLFIDAGITVLLCAGAVSLACSVGQLSPLKSPSLIIAIIKVDYDGVATAAADEMATGTHHVQRNIEPHPQCRV
jgi:hypothetical protein